MYFLKDLVASFTAKDSFRRNIAVISFGSVITYALGFIFTPFLTRIYPPEVYGYFAVLSALMVNFSVIGTLGYEQAILVQKNREDYINIINVNILVSICFFALFVIILIFFLDAVLLFFNIKEVGRWIYILPVIILLNIFTQVATTVSVRNKKFNLSSLARIVSILSSKVYAILHGLLLNSSISGFLLSELFGRLTSLVTNLSSRKNLLNYLLAFRGIFSKKVFRAAKKNSNYPFFTLPSILLNTISMQLPVYFIVNSFGAEIGGYYALSNTLLMVPLTLISRSIAIVFSQRASELYNSHKVSQLKNLLSRVIKSIFIMSLPPLLTIFLFGEEIFTFLLGENWQMAGKFARYMILYFSFEMIAFPLSYLYLVFRIERLLLRISVLGFIFVSVGLLIGSRFDDPIIMIVCLAVGKILDNLTRIFGLYLSPKFSKCEEI